MLTNLKTIQIEVLELLQSIWFPNSSTLGTARCQCKFNTIQLAGILTIHSISARRLSLQNKVRYTDKPTTSKMGEAHNLNTIQELKKDMRGTCVQLAFHNVHHNFWLVSFLAKKKLITLIYSKEFQIDAFIVKHALLNFLIRHTVFPMYGPNMAIQIINLWEGLFTQIARVRLFPSVDSHVFNKTWNISTANRAANSLSTFDSCHPRLIRHKICNQTRTVHDYCTINCCNSLLARSRKPMQSLKL